MPNDEQSLEVADLRAHLDKPLLIEKSDGRFVAQVLGNVAFDNRSSDLSSWYIHVRIAVN
jgi:hypothetical protein